MIQTIQYVFARILKKIRFSAVKNSQIHPSSAVESGAQMVDSIMGRHSFCGYDCTLLNCEIGGFCSIADDVYIGGSQHPIHFVSTSPVFLSHTDSVKTKFARHDYSNLPRTIIGHDVWIGHGAKIKAGVTVGHGAIVGMGSIVTKDVPPYAIVAGNPARLIRLRFDEKTIEGLMLSKWWDSNDMELKKIGQSFNDPSRFLESENQ